MPLPPPQSLSSGPLSFDAHRFQTAAAFYQEGRPAYPDRLIRRTARELGLAPPDAVLDLGCGPGPLAIAFSRYAGRVLAIDPEPAMLRLGEAAGAASVTVPITFQEGSSASIGPHLGRFKAALIGRAFHWMDRVDTLRRLDAMLEPGGAVVLFNTSHARVPENDWQQPYRALQVEYAGVATWQEKSWVRHESVLLRSAFPVLDTVSVIERRTLPPEMLLTRALSSSRTSPARLGERIGAFRDAVLALAAQHAEGGVLTEVIEATALIARRP